MYSGKGKGKGKSKSKTISARTANAIYRKIGTTSSTGPPMYFGGGRTAGLYSPINRKALELKSVDIPNASDKLDVGASTTGSFTQLNGVQVGTAFYNRVGNEIFMKSLHIVGHIHPTGNATAGTVAVPVPEYIRIMVVYDHQPNGAFPSVADLLTGYDNSGGTTSTSYSPLNPTNKDRFSIYMDHRIDIPNNYTGGNDNSIQQVYDYGGVGKVNFNRYIKLGGLKAKYKGSTNPAAIGDVSTGSLFFFVLGNIAAGSNGFGVRASARLTYHD